MESNEFVVFKKRIKFHPFCENSVFKFVESAANDQFLMINENGVNM